MYYDFSFCNDISDYKKELQALDTIIGYRSVIVPNAVSMPFSFPLSKGRKIAANFDDIRFYSMFAAYETELKRYIDNILSFDPIDKTFFDFILNKKQTDLWYDACLYYIAFFYSNRLNSFDGPFPDEISRSLLTKNLKYLSSVIKNRLTFLFNENIEDNNSILLYEFPQAEQEFKKNSLIITNKYHDNLNLLFEDKLKIYGV